MGVVHFFGLRKCDQSDVSSENEIAANCNVGSAEIIALPTNTRVAHGVQPRTVHRQMEALLQSHGVDFGCDKIRGDYKIVTYLIQGMLDRSDNISSDRSFMLDALRIALEYEEPVPNDTDELFGDLLGRLD